MLNGFVAVSTPDQWFYYSGSVSAERRGRFSEMDVGFKTPDGESIVGSTILLKSAREDHVLSLGVRNG